MHYDILPKIKNAGVARKESLFTKNSKLAYAFAQALVRTGYLKAASVKVSGKKSFLELKLAYRNGVPVMQDFRTMSKPGRRLYSPYRELNLVRQGFGVGILSTPKGVLTTQEARKEKVGGEYLAQIW
jgi:small subunit ribosomal protein S8